MNATYRANASYAVSKALEAVKSWQVALEAQKVAGDIEGIAFCQKSLEASEANLKATKDSVNRVHEWN